MNRFFFFFEKHPRPGAGAGGRKPEAEAIFFQKKKTCHFFGRYLDIFLHLVNFFSHQPSVFFWVGWGQNN